MENLNVFVHIHKTGGMTLLNEVIPLNYSEDERISLHGIFDLSICADQIRSRSQPLRLASGHFRYGLHEYLRRPCQYITMLRDPARRIHSLYHYYRARPKEWCLHLTNRGHEPEPIGSLRMFLTDGRFRVADNGMVRAISGVGELHPYQEIGKRECEKAIQNLDNFAVAGVVEHFDASLLLMARLLNWSKLYYARSNQNRTKPKFEDISVSDRSLIESCIKWDQILYNSAAQRLYDQFESEGILDQVNSYQFINGIFYQPARRLHEWARKIKNKFIR